MKLTDNSFVSANVSGVGFSTISWTSRASEFYIVDTTAIIQFMFSTISSHRGITNYSNLRNKIMCLSQKI